MRAKSKLWYQDRLLAGDCHDWLDRLPAESIDLTVFSPPYDALRTYKGNAVFDRQRLGWQLYRASRPGAVCAVVIQDSVIKGVRTAQAFRWVLDWLDNCGWNLWETLIYYRSSLHNHTTRFRLDHEYIHLFVKGNKPFWFDKSEILIPCKSAGRNLGINGRKKRGTNGEWIPLKGGIVGDMKCPGSVWRSEHTPAYSLKAKHPATFPDKLAADLIQCFSREKDLVLDPMMGSGTTPVQASRLSRYYLGFDIAEEYVSLAKERIRNEG